MQHYRQVELFRSTSEGFEYYTCWVPEQYAHPSNLITIKDDKVAWTVMSVGIRQSKDQLVILEDHNCFHSI